MIDYSKVVEAFKIHLQKYNSNDSGIALKISHSYHVADLANKLAKRMELNEEQICLVKTMGLLHDIGRFIQYSKAKAYDDLKTQINHAQVLDTYLFLENHIADFKIPIKYHSLIRIALINHNKLQIDGNLTEEEMFYCHFLRDIDKIDIFRQDAVSFDWLFQEPISKEVENAFIEKRLVDRKKIKTKTDEIFSELAYLFDIHFKESYLLLEETDNLELFLSVIDVQKEYFQEFERIKKELRTYLEEKLDWREE